jgi:hypothetical protein
MLHKVVVQRKANGCVWRVVLDNEAWIEMKLKTRFSQRATAKREILAQEKKAG